MITVFSIFEINFLGSTLPAIIKTKNTVPANEPATDTYEEISDATGIVDTLTVSSIVQFVYHW